MGLHPKNEWKFQTSRRGLLKFLSGATLAGGVVIPESIPENPDGLVKLASRFTHIRAAGKESYVFPRPPYLMEVVAWRFYDSTMPGEESRSFTFFRHDSRHPRCVTNLYRPGMLDDPNEFQLNRMWATILGPRTLAEEFAASSFLNLWLGQKTYSRMSMLDVWRYGGGVLTGEELNQEGRCMNFASAPLFLPRWIVFAVEMECERLWHGLQIQVVLDGLLARTIS